MCDDTVAVIVCENSELIIEELKGGSYWTMLNLDMFSSSDINECIDFLIERYMG
jgi:hypothetical protein